MLTFTYIGCKMYNMNFTFIKIRGQVAKTILYIIYHG